MGWKLLLLLTPFALFACDGGPSTPEAVQGTWGADCGKPFIKIDSRLIHVFPDNADYAVKSVSFDGTHLQLTYDTAFGPAKEIYAFANNTLRLDRGWYKSMDAVWHKDAMVRC